MHGRAAAWCGQTQEAREVRLAQMQEGGGVGVCEGRVSLKSQKNQILMYDLHFTDIFKALKGIKMFLL